MTYLKILYEVYFGIWLASMHGMDLLQAHFFHETTPPIIDKRETSLPTVLGKGKSKNNFYSWLKGPVFHSVQRDDFLFLCYHHDILYLDEANWSNLIFEDTFDLTSTSRGPI